MKLEHIPHTGFAALALTLTTGITRADHGRDFLLLQDAHLSAPLGGTLQTGFDWSDHGAEDEMGLEVGGMIGLTERVSIGANVSFLDESDGWKYASVTPHLLVDLTPKKSPVRIALFAGYEFGSLNAASGHDHGSGAIGHSHEEAKARKKISRNSSTSSASGGHSHRSSSPVMASSAATQCGPEFGPDAPPCDDGNGGSGHDHNSHDHSNSSHGSSHSDPKEQTKKGHSHPEDGGKEATEEHEESHEHSGIHRHGQSGLHARLIVEADLTPADKLVLNVINLTPEDGKAAWGYAAGLRHSFNHDLAVGLEATGDFGDNNEHILMAGGYFSPHHTLTLKFGAGFGLTKESPEATVRLGAVLRF